MADRLWSYPELKHVTVNQYNSSSEELAQQVNKIYHRGENIRSAEDIDKIKRGKTIFNKNQRL
ncbi:MAG: hypothetical protein KKD39_01525 [Candidatus Altiarchaeota archaeon]|nr:hypothetical protein [Candidatus Altiarchaeota archaeon]